MIRLTRRNNDAIVINLHTIAYVEATPDTLVTLTTGERIHVRESLDTVVAGAIAYQRKFTVGVPVITRAVEEDETDGEPDAAGQAAR